MNWTYDLPKSDGFYWWKIEQNGKPTICQIIDDKIYAIGTSQSFSLHNFYYQQFSDIPIQLPICD